MTPSTSFLPELFEEAIKDFEKHFAPPENSRIIFSGKYGAGKTTFLETYFKLGNDPASEDNNYEVIRLFPVNYSVGSNQDIFKFIKYDILIELLKKGVDLESLDLQLSHYVALYASEKWESIGVEVAKAAAAIGKHAEPAFDYVEKILNFFIGQKDRLKKYIKEKHDKFDDSAIAIDFLKKLEASDDNPYEESLISRIIEKKIQQLKGEGDNQKKVVLVVDDMDRIDPEHIFRILNVFAAHFDISHSRTSNKFGFDKIILVCDIDNIRGAFHHRYGSELNFSGYMDKFYSDDVYNFNITKSVLSAVLELTKRYNIQHVPSLKYRIESYSGDLYHWLIKSFILSGSLNLRSLTKFIDRGTPVSLKASVMIDTMNIKLTDQDLLWTLMVLSKIFGDRNSFLTAVQKLKIEDLIDENVDFEKVFKLFLTLTTLKQHKLTRRVNSNYTITSTKTNLSFDTSRRDEGPDIIKNVAFTDAPDGEEERAIAFSSNLIPLMHDTILELYRLGFLV